MVVCDRCGHDELDQRDCFEFLRVRNRGGSAEMTLSSQLCPRCCEIIEAQLKALLLGQPVCNAPSIPSSTTMQEPAQPIRSPVILFSDGHYVLTENVIYARDTVGDEHGQNLKGEPSLRIYLASGYSLDVTGRDRGHMLRILGNSITPEELL